MNNQIVTLLHGLSVPIFLFQFEPVIRNPDDKELKLILYLILILLYTIIVDVNIVY